MFSFEQLDIYQKAKSYHSKVFRLLKLQKGLPRYVRDQLGRASFSIMLNIAEGSGRFAKGDRRHFFVTARSSSFECAAAIGFLLEEKEIDSSVGLGLLEELEGISKGLFAMIRALESGQ